MLISDCSSPVRKNFLQVKKLLEVPNLVSIETVDSLNLAKRIRGRADPSRHGSFANGKPSLPFKLLKAQDITNITKQSNLNQVGCKLCGCFYGTDSNFQPIWKTYPQNMENCAIVWEQHGTNRVFSP